MDRSRGLVEAAAESESARFAVADLRALPLGSGRFDVVVANHSLNEVRDPTAAVAEFARVLRPAGRLVALMLHPCFYDGRDERGRRYDIDSDRYFTSRRVEQRFNVSGIVSPASTVIWLRPLEFYFGVLAAAGFSVTQLCEPRPPVRRRRADPWWSESFRRPLFLLLVAERR